MHQKLTKHGRFCEQNNHLPTKSHVELKDNSNVTQQRRDANMGMCILLGTCSQLRSIFPGENVLSTMGKGIIVYECASHPSNIKLDSYKFVADSSYVTSYYV
jgi:hypothetical protein